MFQKVRYTDPSVHSKCILKPAIKTMNNNMEENGLVPSRLASEVLPRFLFLSSDFLSQKESVEALKLAQAEMNSNVADKRVLEALVRNIPPAAVGKNKMEEKVLVYSERNIKWLDALESFMLWEEWWKFLTKPRTWKRRLMHSRQSVIIVNSNQNCYYFSSNVQLISHTAKMRVTEIVQTFSPRSFLFSDAIKQETSGLKQKKPGKLF